MKRLSLVLIIMAIAAGTSFAFVFGYTSSPLLSEESMILSRSRIAVSGPAYPTPVGGVYMGQKFGDDRFGWYIDGSFTNSSYYAASDGEEYDFRFFYTHQELQFFPARNAAYFFGAGLEYMVMRQYYPDGDEIDDFISTGGYPIFSVGVSRSVAALHVGLRYTQRFQIDLDRDLLGPGEFALQVGFTI